MAWCSLKRRIAKAISWLRHFKDSRHSPEPIDFVTNPALSSPTTSRSSSSGAFEVGDANPAEKERYRTDDSWLFEVQKQSPYHAASFSLQEDFQVVYADQRSDECTEIEADASVEDLVEMAPDILVIQQPDDCPRKKVSLWLESNN